jgi:hypothetical protein
MSIGGIITADNGTGSVWDFQIAPAPDDRYLPGIMANKGDSAYLYIGPRLREEFLHVQYSLYGIPIPISVGVRRLTGNMVYAADLTEVVTTWSDGGSRDHNATLYSYLANFMVSFGVSDPLLDPTHAVATLTMQLGTFFDGKPAFNNETVTLGSVTYTWKTVLTGAANEVAIGHGNINSLKNLVAAVNHDAGEGTTYGTGTVANAACTGFVRGVTAVFVATAVGSAGNSVVSTETMKNGSFGSSTFVYRARKVLRVWAAGNLIIDRTGGGKVMPIGTRLSYPNGPTEAPELIPVNAEVKYRFYPGSFTQEPDPTILEKENVDTWTAYRGQMCIFFPDFPLYFFNNTIPAITIELGDDTALRTQTYIMDASPQPDGDMLAVDVKGGLAYANNPGPLYQYDLDGNEFLTSVVLDNARNDGSQIIPWSGNLITSDADLAIYQRISIVDAASGSTLASLGANASSTGGGGVIRQMLHICPIRITTPLAPLETFIFCSQFRTIQIVIVNPLDGTLKYVWNDETLVSLVSTGNLRCSCPGADLYGSHVAYLGVGGIGAGVTIGVFRLVVDGSILNSVPDALTQFGVSGNPAESAVPWYIPPDGYSPRGMAYDQFSNNLVIMLDKPGSSDPQRVVCINGDSGDVVWDQEIDYRLSAVDVNFWQSNVDPGFLATIKDGVDVIVLEIDLATGAVTEYTGTDDDTHGGSGGFFGHGTTHTLSSCVGDAGSQSVTGFDAGGDLARMYYNRLNDSRTTLKYFIEFMAKQIGLMVPDEFSVDDGVDDAIDGGILAEPVQYSQFLANLALIYRLDVIESGDVIKVLRKSLDDGTDFDIPSADLLFMQNAISFLIRRETDTSMANAVQLTFLDKSMNFNPNFVFAQRSGFPVPTSKATSPLNLGMPVAITSTEAKTLAYLLLYKMWATKNSQSWRLGPEHLQIEPGDIGSVADGSLGYTVKIAETSINGDLSITLKAQSLLSDAPIEVTGENPPPWEPDTKGFSRTQVIPIDSVLIRASDDVATYDTDDATMYFVIAPTSRRSYRGGSAQFGVSPTTYTVIGTTTVAPVLGYLTAVLGNPGDPWATDTVNTIEVQIACGDETRLVSISDLELLGYENTALVGAPGRWELVQFRDVANPSDHKYSLSTLLRARRGSEDNIANHQVGDYFILISSARSHSVKATFLDEKLFYRGYSINQAPKDGLVRTTLFAAESAKPLRPTMESAAMATLDLVISWARRTRGNGEWVDGTSDVPVFETVDIFDIEFYSDNTFATLLGVTTSDIDTGAGSSSATEATISPAQQTAIFGGAVIAGNTIYVRIRQRGSVTDVLGRNADSTLVVG